MIRGLEHLTYEERLRAGTVQPGEEQALGDLINVCKHLMGNTMEAGARLFSVVPSDRTRGNGHKLKYRKFFSNIRRLFFTVRMIEHRNKLPREDVEFPSLEIFKSSVDTALRTELEFPLL